MTPEEKLERVEELLAQRDEINQELLQLMGAAPEGEEEEHDGFCLRQARTVIKSVLSGEENMKKEIKAHVALKANGMPLKHILHEHYAVFPTHAAAGKNVDSDKLDRIVPCVIIYEV